MDVSLVHDLVAVEEGYIADGATLLHRAREAVVMAKFLIFWPLEGLFEPNLCSA